MASNLDIFELKCLLQNINIKLCARIESGVKQLLALVTHNSDIILHYSFGELPVVLKRIPWYASKSRFIQAICFDPTATWLLVICADGSLHIVPFLSLVDKKQKVDCKWSTTDLTHFPKPQQTPDRKPTAVVWWQTLDSNQNGLIGYEDGTIALISLTDGRCLGTCSVNEAITELNLCQDNSLDAIFLLINGVSGKQWKHILEQHSMGYVWPPELANHTDDSTQSRLSSLRQLGVDKLVSLRQRLVEGRNSKKDNSSDTTSESSLQSDSSHSGPELIPHLPQTHFSPQYARDRYLFSTFYKPTCLVTVHAADVEAAPLYTHKLPTGTEDFLLTDKLIFTLSSHKKTISIVSSNLSECLRDCDSEFNIDALVARFSIDNEHILKIYKLADLSAVRLRKCRDDKRDKLFEMPKTVDDLNIRKIRIDTCVLVTSKAVYKINVSISPIEKFVQHIVRESDYDKAERLADIFGLNVQQLLEGCGDLLISRGSFHSGIILYKQAKVHLLKRVLKLAISADCKTLLKFVHLCLSASKVDMSVATKIHIGNLAVMAYTELILRYGGSTRISNTKDFMNFLRYEGFYDQILAVNVACQAAHWKIVNLLARTRGLQPEVVSAFGQILHSARAPRPTDLDFIYSLSEPSLTQSLLLSPKSAEIIFQYIRANVEVFPIDILKRFILQLDPSQPCAIPLVARKFQTHKSSLSLESTLDSSDCDYHDEDSTVVKDMIETFIIVLVHLISKTDENSYKLLYLERIKVSHETILEPSLTKFPDIQPLNCGYEHAAIVRNDLVYTMGVSSSGCLGLGPLLSQSSPARLVQTLADLKVRVISVSCGRKHTLFLTDYGVYSCGSNNYGQLGLGHSVQECPYPQLLSDLSAVKIVQVVCGQYHSMALTSDGKVYTWGWGIHGQLGHGGCSNESHPRRLNFSKKVKQVTAGHAHSLILTLDGELFGFGSNAFGQLESSHGGANKYSNPMRIHIMPQLLTPIEKVSSAYFHNIAILEDQEVYTWGASPQEVRLVQAKNHHKANGISTKPPESWKISVNVYSGSNRGPIDQISIGYRHTVILHNGKMLWGKNKDDDLSPPHLRDQDTLNIFNYRFLHVSCGFDYTMAVDHIGRLLAWGSVSMAQTILGRSVDDETKSDGKFIISKNTKRILRFPNTIQGNSNHFPIEVPGLPTMTITFNPTNHQLIFARNFIPHSIIKIENTCMPLYDDEETRTNCFGDIRSSPKYNFGQKTLHFVLETYYSLYDYDFIQQICLNLQNYQAASKIAILGEHYCDSLSFQLKAFKGFMNLYATEFQEFCEEYASLNQDKKQENYIELIRNVNTLNDKNSGRSDSLEQLSSNTPAQILSTSSSLDSIRLWDDQEHQGGCESPCEAGEIGDIRHNMSQFVQSLKNNQISAPISSVSKLVSESNKISFISNIEFEVKDKNIKNILDMASNLVDFYIQKIYSSENHILMQNILMQVIEFWLINNLPVPILENILLKNMDKYFYPLSILLFCKDFSNDSDELISNGAVQKNSARFLKEFSTKFCLQLCLMVVENVNKI